MADQKKGASGSTVHCTPPAMVQKTRLTHNDQAPLEFFCLKTLREPEPV